MTRTTSFKIFGFITANNPLIVDHTMALSLPAFKTFHVLILEFFVLTLQRSGVMIAKLFYAWWGFTSADAFIESSPGQGFRVSDFAEIIDIIDTADNNFVSTRNHWS